MSVNVCKAFPGKHTFQAVIPPQIASSEAMVIISHRQVSDSASVCFYYFHVVEAVRLP